MLAGSMDAALKLPRLGYRFQMNHFASDVLIHFAVAPRLLVAKVFAKFTHPGIVIVLF